MNLPLHLASYREINAFIEGIDVLFMTRGQQVYAGEQHAGLTMLEHSLQCAQLAEGAQAPAQLVAAALLHDIGHFLTPPEMCGNHDVDNTHEERAYVLLATALPAEVTEPVRLHVAAKRYLMRVDPLYAANLSPASRHTLRLQGNTMTVFETAAFESRPFAQEAVKLTRWDDAAATPGKRTPPLAYFLSMLSDQMHMSALSPRTDIGAFNYS
ncbi:MAG: HD domain-containing protein [Burkholderiales bacterium]|nr:HD domain-containing protein [Burkholderiales bacterium]